MLYDTIVAIDLETTGADPYNDQIIEIGAAIYKDGKVTDTFSKLAKNEIEMSAPIIKLTGITPQMLEDQPPLENILDEFLTFLPEDAICIAHNASFERSFLTRATKNKFKNTVVDTVGLSRICFPELESHSLTCLCEFLKIKPDDVHRALSDCETLLQVWQAIIEKLLTLPLAIVAEINFLLAVHNKHPYFELFRKLEAEIISTNFGKHTSKINEVYESLDIKMQPPEEVSDKEDWTRLDRGKIEWIFKEGGFLEKSFENFEPRPGQVDMAGEVVTAYNDSKHLLVEAGTGTGKSLAYLIPSVIWARENSVPVVISTNTKNLQAQLYEKDIPFVKETLGIDFKAAILKGRSNYLCLRKLFYVLRQAEHELDSEERMQLATVLSWSVWTKTGDISENIVSGRPGFFKTWAKMSCTGEECMARGCKQYNKCFLWKARLKALQAQVIIANHSLVFADLNATNPNLPPYAQIVFDEAHNLEDAATSHLSTEVSPLKFGIMTGRMVRKNRKKKNSGLIPSIIDKVKSARIEEELKNQLLDNAEKIPLLMEEAEAAGEHFFEEVEILLKTSKARSSLRYCPERKREQQWEGVDHAKKEMCAALAGVMHTAGNLQDDIKDCDEDLLEYKREFSRDLIAAIQSIKEFTEDVEFVLEAGNNEYVYWIERASNKPGNVKLIGAPISVGQLLHDQLYAKRRSIIFCSATMSVKNNFKFLKKRLGINLVDKDRLTEFDAGTPFDFPKQCQVMVPSFLPEPGERGKDYSTELAELMAEVFRRTNGRGMTLFTSYEMLRRSYEILNERFLGEGIEILAQGMSGSRKNITSIFKRDIHSVLLGTHSFWEGVDVVGEALSCLSIARLPFGVFTDPLIEARCEQTESEGENAFMNFSLPSAVIRFRQGFGRLIRHKSDRGIVIIADRRIIAKRYGKMFQDSIPCPTNVYNDKEKMLEDIADFLGTSFRE